MISPFWAETTSAIKTILSFKTDLSFSVAYLGNKIHSMERLAFSLRHDTEKGNKYWEKWKTLFKSEVILQAKE